MVAAVVDMAGSPTPRDPAYHAAAVTPSDSVDLAHITTALWVVGTGSATLHVTMAGGEDVTLTIGAWTGVLPIRVSRVWSTGTATTTVVAFWR